MQPGRIVCSCMFKWVSVTFNVQTLRREGRLLAICRAFRSSHFIGLQSTSDRTEPGEDSPVYTTKADKFRVYRFPWRQGSLFPSKHSGVAIAIRENTFLPANVRRIYSPPSQLAGRGGALKLVRGDAAFLIMSLDLPPSPSNLREKQLSEKFWKWARKILDETPSRVVPVLLLDANDHISHTSWADQVGKYSSKKRLSMASAWENCCEITICRRRTLTFPWERLSLDPSPTLRLTLRVFRPPFVFTDAAHYTMMETGCNWQLRGDGIIVPSSVFFNTSSRMVRTREGKSINGTRPNLRRVLFLRWSGPPFCHEWRKLAGTTKSGTIWQFPIFGRNSIRCL